MRVQRLGILDQARIQIAAHPTDVSAAARIYYYYQQQGNIAAATRSLLEYRQRKDAQHSALTAEELYTLGQLFEGVHNYDEAARSYYALNNAGDGERGLAGIANVLLTAPEQPIHIGAGDLKGRGADAQIELPVAQETLVMTQRPNLLAFRLHPRRPFAQGADIIIAEGESAGEFESGSFRFLAEAR